MTNEDRRLLIATAKAVASVLNGVSPDGEQGKLRQEILDCLAAPPTVQGSTEPFDGPGYQYAFGNDPH